MTEDAISIGGVDLADPDTYASGMPFDAFRKLRECAPVAWHPYKDGPGFLALTGYDEVFAVSRDSATWSSEATGVYFDAPGPDDIADQRGVMMLTMDPPRHTKLRALVSKGFKPRQVAKLNERITDMARDVVDSVIERGECDFVTDVAGALPSYVIAEHARHSAGRRLPALRADRDHEHRFDRRLARHQGGRRDVWVLNGTRGPQTCGSLR